MYELLSRKSTNSTTQTLEQVVQRTYDEYSSEFLLPGESDQAKHKELRGMNDFKFQDHILPINYPGEAKVVVGIAAAGSETLAAGSQA